MAAHGDNIPIFIQDPFVGRSLGQGEKELTKGELGKRFWFRDSTDRNRIQRYLENDALTDPRTHYDAFRTLGPQLSAPSREEWLAVDFFGMFSRLMRHYVFGPEFQIRGKNSAPNASHVERIFGTSNCLQLFTQGAEQVTALGDTIYRVDIEDKEDPEDPEEMLPQASFKSIHPAHYFPQLDPLDATRVIAVDLAWVLPISADQKGTHGVAEDLIVLFERHSIDDDGGQVEYDLWSWEGTKRVRQLDIDAFFPELEDGPTGIDEIPIVHVGNNVKAGEHYGTSEFMRIRRLVLALESRLSQEDEVLDKHARPKLIVGPGVLDTDGRSRLAHFDIIEIEPSILEKAVKPEYLTWNMQIEGIRHEIEKLEEYLFMVTETSPASFGLERDGSQVESARALRFKAHRTVNKVFDQREAWTCGIIDMFRIAQKLENAAREEDDINTYKRGPIEIIWPDPIIEDQDADVQNYVVTKQAGLVSRKRAVRDLWNLSEKDADAEVQEILQDQTDEAETEPVVPPTGEEFPELGGPIPPVEQPIIVSGQEPPTPARSV